MSTLEHILAGIGCCTVVALLMVLVGWLFSTPRSGRPSAPKNLPGPKPMPTDSWKEAP